MSSHGLKMSGSLFWVTHRRRDYGPFDYEWSKDFCGIELQFQGRKFGEYCSSDEIYADLQEFGLPMSVVEVASITLGCIVYGVLNGRTEPERTELVLDRLRSLGYERFAHIESAENAA